MMNEMIKKVLFVFMLLVVSEVALSTEGDLHKTIINIDGNRSVYTGISGEKAWTKNVYGRKIQIVKFGDNTYTMNYGDMNRMDVVEGKHIQVYKNALVRVNNKNQRADIKVIKMELITQIFVEFVTGDNIQFIIKHK